MATIKKEDYMEFVGCIIDVFEDFLDDKGIDIPNYEREERIDEGEENLAIIYGSDYDWIADKLYRILDCCE